MPYTILEPEAGGYTVLEPESSVSPQDATIGPSPEPPITEYGGLSAIPEMLNLGIEKAGRLGVDAMNTGFKAESYLLGRHGKVAHPAEYGKPAFDFTKAPSWMKQVAGGGNPFAPDQIHQGVGESLAQSATGFTTPENLMMMPLLPIRAILKLLTAQQAANIPGESVDAYHVVTDPSVSPQDKVKKVADLATLVAMTTAGAKALHETMPAAPMVKPPTELDNVLNNVLNREGNVVPSQGAAAVNPVVQARPETAPPPVVPGVGGGFVPKAKGPGFQNMIDNLRNIVQVASGADPNAKVGGVPIEPPKALPLIHPVEKQDTQITPPEGFILENQTPTTEVPTPSQTESLPSEPGAEPPPVESVIEDQIARDRKEVEADAGLNHDKNGLLQLLMNKEQLKGMPRAVKQQFMDRGDAATTVAEVAALKDEVNKAYPATKEQASVPIVTPMGEPPTLEALARQVADPKGARLTKEQLASLPDVGTPKHGAYLKRVQELRKAPPPQEIPELASPRDLTARFKAGKEHDATQMLNWLRNNHPVESKVLEDLGLRKEFEGKKATPEAVGKWIEENGPRVEVRTKGGPKSKAITNQDVTRLAELEHKLDTDFPSWRADSSAYRNDGRFRVVYDEYKALVDKPGNVEESTHWQSIAPKPEADMPGYVEIAVVKPFEAKTAKIENTAEGQARARAELARRPGTGGVATRHAAGYPTEFESTPQFPSSHSFPPNTLAFVRGYMEGDTFHIIEVQSDWAQQAREYKERFGDGRPQFEDQRVAKEPLLAHYERLALKAAVEHAKKEGAKRIAVQDAESAMLMEGHDRAAPRPRRAIETGERGDMGGALVRYESTGESATEADITQAKGMRLHYDQTLPRILEELTGKKGEAVSFGEHKMAYERLDRQAPNGDVTGYDKGNARKDLIFRNADGTPKTDVSARAYPLDKVKEQFSMFGKDRPAPDVASMPEATTFANVHPSQVEDFKALGIREGATAQQVIERIAEDPTKYGQDKVALAGFLAENFEHVLAKTKVEGDAGRSTRPNYEPINQSIKLALDKRAVWEANDWPIEDVMLHESAHAATVWQTLNPRTELQKASLARLTDIMEQSKMRLTSAEKAMIGKTQEGLAYAHSNPQEFVANLFDSASLREHLNQFSVGGKNLFERAWDTIKELIGIKKGSALEQAFDTLKMLGEERGDIRANREGYDVPPLEMPQRTRTTSVIDEASNKEKFSAWVNKRQGYSAPKHVAANPEVANKLVRYASARIAAPEVARSVATDVLGSHWKDKRFDLALGRVLVEDRLRAIKKTFNDLANAEPDPIKKQELFDKANSVRTLIGSEIPTEAAFQAAIHNPEMAAAIQRHIDTVQPMAEGMHRALGGEVSAPGEETGAFVNLRAMFDDVNIDEARKMIFGSRKGGLTNPLKRGSVFSKQAKGTAETYDLSYRSIAERMVRGNFEQDALRKYYTALESAGLGYIEKPKDLALEAKQTTSGNKLATIPVEIKGTGPGMTSMKKLYVRPDLASELRQAVQTDGALPRTALSRILDVVTKTQMLGLTDFAYHSANMLATIAGSQGSRSAWYDIVRKATPLGVLDGAVRMGYESMKVMMDTPEVQKMIADFSEVGAGRAKPEHQGIVSKGLQFAGMDKETAKLFSSSHWMKVLDRGGRVAMSKMFDNMVQRGLIDGSELNRREWINQMGQYNERLMGKYQALLRDSTLSSFVVAGRTMNRNAFRRITASQVVKAANPKAWATMKVIDAVSLFSLLYAIPVVANMATSGKPFGRPGTHPGAIDLGGAIGEDGKHKEFDLLQLLLLRRGQRITGFDALRRGQSEHLSVKDTVQGIMKDIFDGIVHPWAGPTVRFAKVAATGKDTRGYLESKNPEDYTQNLYAALKGANPMVAAMLKDPEKGKLKSTMGSLAPALGLKDSRTPTVEEQGKLQGTIGQRRQAMKQPKPERDELASRAAGERAYWGAYAKQDALKADLPDHQQNWLEEHKLKLRGFETEITQGGVKLPGSVEENDFMKAAVRDQYQKQIQRLVDSSAFQSLPEAKQQARLDALLTLARRRARSQLRRKMSTPFEPYSLNGK